MSSASWSESWPKRARRVAMLAAVAIGCSGSPAMSQQASRTALGFTVNQAIAGKAAYDANCASCHGADLAGAGPSVALRGAAFLEKWSGQPAELLFAQVRRMPPGQSSSLTPAESANILAYVLQSNGIYSGARALPVADEALATLAVPTPGAQPLGVVAREPVVITPSGASRLDRLSAVTEQTLRAPSPNDWLHWRRTYDALGFSPLQQVNRRNVAALQLAWSWALPRGDNMMAPLVHDGVLFAYSHGDVLEALDATSGELLWRYERKLRPGATFQGKKGVAIHGENLFVPTSDMHVLAINARSGAVVWDHAIETDGQIDFQIKSSPLIAAGKVIIGVNGFTTRGGNFIVALDVASGQEVWRFNTVARPGEPGGDSWNGLAVPSRSGGSVWVAGTYDPALNLVYFGAAPTYNTAALRVPQPGFTSDALYTNATLALQADTGKLVWFFQHQKNDQLDHDWAFERQVMDLSFQGARRKVVVTGGKQAIFEALDAASGDYLFSIDLGLQNVILGIDPETGAKRINPAAIPAPQQVLRRGTLPGICPDLLGARNLMSSAYDPTSGMLYVPLSDTCLQPWPDGAQWQRQPDPAGLGKFGIIQAIDLRARKVDWKIRERAAPVSGVLTTGGGLLFVGDADRWFRAYDTRNGKPLWTTRLDNVPTSYPIAYAVEGRQYVAVATNQGFVHAQAMQRAAGIAPQPNAGATLWVFALPSDKTR